MAVQLIVISGRAGSGKTSVANEMSQVLKRQGISHAHIDGDNLDAMYPEEPAADILLPNLAAMWANYYHLRGVTKLILSGTSIVLEMERVKKAIEWACRETYHPQGVLLWKTNVMPPALVDGRAFILVVPDTVAVNRLRKREVGSELDALVRSSRKMSAVLEEDVGGWARRVHTDNETVRTVANDILKTAGWI